MRATLFLVMLLAGCGTTVGPMPPSDASLPDVQLGLIDGCPARHGARGAWESIELPASFTPRGLPVVFGVGEQLLVYGGQGSRDITDHWLFDPTSQRWMQLPGDGPRADVRALAATWMSDRRELFLWHTIDRRGVRGTLDGPWRPLPTQNAPRTFANRAVYVAGLVFVAGSTAEGDHNEFALYDPVNDRWEPVLAPREQTARSSYSLVVASDEVLLWGGADATTGTGVPRNDGWRFHVPTREWRSVTRDGAPTARFAHSAFWSGESMLVWGGSNGSQMRSGGARYFPSPDVWLPMNMNNAPSLENTDLTYDNRAAWMGNDLFVWLLTNAGTATAARYDPRADQWFAAEPPPVPAQRFEATTQWFRCGLYVVGGRTRPGASVQFTRSIVRWTP